MENGKLKIAVFTGKMVTFNFPFSILNYNRAGMPALLYKA